MPSQQHKAGDLHGNVPESAPAALMLIDVINDLDFPNNEEIVCEAAFLGRTIAVLKARFKRAIKVVGVERITRRCIASSMRARSSSSAAAKKDSPGRKSTTTSGEKSNCSE